MKIEVNEENEIYVPDLGTSGGTLRLSNLALQLFNRGTRQSVMDTFNGLDKDNFNLALNAIKLRFNI